MIRHLVIVLTLYLNLSNGIYYDSYCGEVATDERMAELTAAGTVEKCTNNIEPCNETEGRRVDGSCNNLNHPTYGAFHTPQDRLFDADYDINFEPKKSKSGKPLMIPRNLRQAILPVGKGISEYFNQLLALSAEFIATDIIAVQDIRNYLFVTTNCCEESGKFEYMCIPNIIPEDDPVHSFSGYRCMNLTRPLSFQNEGCVANNTTPDRLDYTTPTWDLSNIYAFDVDIISTIRAYEGGRLKSEIVNGREFSSDGNSSCTIQQAIETGCTRNVPNGVIGTNIFSNLYWRAHNQIASKLAELNPHWDDDKLFYISRDINIAMYTQIVYYEFWPLLIGQDNMVQNNIILEQNTGYRDLYDDSVDLKIYLEFAIVTRWFHTIQEGILHKRSPNGTYVGDMRIVDLSNSVHNLAIDDDMVIILHGAVTQPGGDHDYVVDPDIADRGFGPVQATMDLCTQDIKKGRYFGMAPYMTYRDMRMNYTKIHETFEDLEDIICKKHLEMLRTVYEHEEDLELLPGIMLENHIEGGHIPDTAAYIIMLQLKRSLITDRHWYERPNRPNAFTPDQMFEVRKSNLAGLLCMVGDEVTHVQPQAFRRISSENQMVSCDEIPQVDLSFWKETTD